MTGFEQQTSGVGSVRSTNWAITAALLLNSFKGRKFRVDFWAANSHRGLQKFKFEEWSVQGIEIVNT